MVPPTSGSSSSAAGAAVPKFRMVTSCKGCSALRKGCSDDCAIRPCLQWIKDDPEAQGRATHFLAKFYGRAGLQNLIAAAPPGADRPAVFRSLLYEACGRIVNPVYGAVGLLWSGNWEKCVNAVEAVLKGDLDLVVPVDAEHKQGPNPVVQAYAAAPPPPPLGARPGGPGDIRHFAKDSDAAVASDLLRFARAGRGRPGFKRAAGSSSKSPNPKLLKGKASTSNNVPPLGQQQEAEELEPVPMMALELGHVGWRDEEFAGSHGHHLQGSKENTDVEAAAFNVTQAEAVPPVGNQVLIADQEAEEEVGLELTLG